MAHITTITAGIDTSKAKLDIAIHGQSEVCTVENNLPGWQKLAVRMREAEVQRIGIEATGGYERGVTRHLQAQGFTVIVLQPLQVKAFARLHLKRAKNDHLDAILIAACTHFLDAGSKMAPDARFDGLSDHLTYIEQIEEDMVRLQTRMEHITDKRRRSTVKADLARLDTRRSSELLLLTKSLRLHVDLSRRLDLVSSVPGIGLRTALAIVVRMPELGQVSREQAAALAGLAPFVRQSGQHQGETHIGGGRERLRRSLYAAALAGAFRWNKALITLYQRLKARGKTHKLALVACARKLLVFANAVVQRGTPWEAKPATD